MFLSRTTYGVSSLLLAAAGLMAQGGAGTSASLPGPAPVANASAPLMGYFFDASRQVLQSMVGIPGSGFPGAGIAVNSTLVEISPAQDYALAVTADSGQLTVVPLDGRSPAPVNGAMSGITLIGISPAGGAALVYAAATGQAQLFTGLPSSPAPAGTFDWSALPGVVTAMAVDDAADLALVAAMANGTTLYAASNGNGPAAIYSVASIAAVAFVAHSRQAVATAPADSQVLWIQDNGGVPGAVVLAGASAGLTAPQSVAAALDGSRAFVLDSGAVLAIPLAGGAPASAACACQPSRLQRMRGGDVFLLTPSLSASVAVVDGSSPVLDLELMPAAPPLSAQATGGAKQ